MNGRVLTERLLATTSLAALILAGTGQQNAHAVVPCTVINPGGNYSNAGAVDCVFISNSNTTSVTNAASGAMGPPVSNTSAIGVTDTGTLTGGIFNAGRIVGLSAGTRSIGIGVDGLVQGGISNSGTITINTTANFVAAYGINVGEDLPSSVTSFGGGLSNGGTISVAVHAQGIDGSAGVTLNVGTFSGSLSNGPGSTIALNLVATTGGAFGVGLGLSADTFTGGNIINSGTIVATGTASGGASIDGLRVDTSTLSGGSFLNSGTVTAAANAGDGDATARGVTLDGFSSGGFSSGISNSGIVGASATLTTGSHNASATGFGLFVGTLAGGFANSGTITGLANNASTGAAFATGADLTGYTWAGGFSNSGTISGTATAANGNASAAGLFLSNINTFAGGILNSGTVSGNATSTNRSASAYGITLSGSLFSGGLSNGGTISASAMAQGVSGISAQAGALLLSFDTFAGNIVNSGTLTAFASNTACCASAIANTLIVGSTAVSFGTATAGGGILNTGTISAAASNVGGPGCCGSAIARAVGISVSTFLGGITNSGTITASVTALVANGGSANVQAFGIQAFVSTFNGGILNSGTIAATVTGRTVAGATGGVFACAAAVALVGSTFNGGFVNGGSIAATASASACCAVAVASGAGLFFSTFNGGLTNSGTISAVATATGSPWGAATATALSFSGNVVNGGFINSGLISATASAACCAHAIGVRLNVATFNGGINNSGTIMAQAAGLSAHAIGIRAAGFGGTIVNSGTIAGLISGSTRGYGIGIQFINGHGTITNSGLIQGSTVGIDMQFADAASTVNQTAGTIMGGPFNGCCGAAIQLSLHKDIVNITGGTILGDIRGGNNNAGTGNIVNVNMGAGSTFTYAGQILNVGVVNLQSGRLLLQNMTAAGILTTNYNQSAGSTLALEVSPSANAATNHASISAAGAISLASGAVLQAFEGAFAWTPGTYTYAGVVNAGSTTGSFTATSNSPFFVASLSQSSTVDNLTLTMLSPSQVPGLNGNQQNVANTIIGIPGGNATLDQLFTLSNPGPALTQLSGSQFTATNYQPLIQAWQMFTDSLSSRLSQGDGYGGTISASLDPSHGIRFAQADIPQVAQMSDAGHAPASSAPHRWGLWARGYGLSSTAPSTATSAPYSESGAGLILGADNQITDRIVAGVALNVSTDKATVTGGGFTQSNAYQGSAYGQYAIDPNWYVNGIAGFGWQTYSSQRVVTLGTTNVNNGSFDGQSYRLYGETGYTLHPAFMPLTRFTPYLGLGYLHVHTDGFTETGSATALNVQAMDPNSFTTTLGARAAATFQIGGTSFRPELRAAWQHEFLDASATMRAAFAAAPGAPVFTATGTAFSRESFVGGAGVTTTITSSTQVFFDYDAKVNGGYTAQSISGGLRVQF
jgi:fibronectin-binding autotransporter adhesin